MDPPQYWWDYNAANFKREYPFPGNNEVKMIYSGGSSWTESDSTGFSKLKAHQSPKLECIVYQNVMMHDGCKFADIVLPVCTTIEEESVAALADNYCHLFYNNKVVEPLGESKSDFTICCEIAKKLDYLDTYLTKGKEGDDQIHEWCQQTYETSGIADQISWEDFKKNRFISLDIEWSAFDALPITTLFYNDPKANPLSTPSGKLEFESQWLLENFPDDKERPPVAHWVRGGSKAEGWMLDESLESDRAKDYPLLMMSTNKHFGMHAIGREQAWTREIERVIGWDGYSYFPCWINTEDAANRGIKNGDIIKVFNERGGVLAGAVVTDRTMPGVVCIQQAGGCDNIIPTELNRGGNPNAIASGMISTHAHFATHTSYLVQAEKVTGAQMDDWRQNYPDAFNRDYDPRYDFKLSGWVVNDKEATNG